MIHPKLIRYAFDATGMSPNNLVKDEKHTLVRKRFRAVVPYHGLFYTHSFIIKDEATGLELLRGKDFVFAELHQSLALLLGDKEPVGVVIVINPAVSDTVSLTYQAVGDHYSVDTSTIESLLKKKTDPDISQLYYDIENRPEAMIPSPHLHDLGDVQGLESVVYYIERQRNALLWADSPRIESIMRYVSDSIDSMVLRMMNRIHTEYIALILEYKRDFTKKAIGLSMVENLPLASDREAIDAFGDDWGHRPLPDDRYIATKALVAFKEVLYGALVSSNITNIGKPYGKLVEPLLTALAAIPQGSTFILDTMRNVKTIRQQIDPVVYPSEADQSKRWAIKKVIEKPGNTGAILMGIDMSTGEMYTGNLKRSQSGTLSLSWARHMNERDTDQYLAKLIEHIFSTDHPHKERKNQVGLSDVENLPVATREDIVCRKPVRRYITYDGLLLYAKAFLTGKKDEEDIAEGDSPNAIEQYQTIFAPCGPCGSFKEKVVTEKVAAEKVCEEKGKLILTYCDTGFIKKALYHDGNCGTYSEELERDSVDCGWAPPALVPDRFSMGWYASVETTKDTIYERIEYDSDDGPIVDYYPGKKERYEPHSVLATQPVEHFVEPSDDAIYLNPFAGHRGNELGITFAEPHNKNADSNLIQSLVNNPEDYYGYAGGASLETVHPLFTNLRFFKLYSKQAEFTPMAASCLIGVDDGFWEAGMRIVPELPTTIQTGNYLSGNTRQPYLEINDLSLVNYNLTQATAMSKLLLYKVKSGFAYNATTGSGILAVTNHTSFFRNPNEITFELVAQIAQDPLNPPQGLSFRVVEDIFSSGIHTLSKAEYDSLMTPPVSPMPATFSTFPYVMVDFPVGAIKLCVYDVNNRLRGWTYYYQTLVSSDQFIPTDNRHDSSDHLEMVATQGFDRWYASQREEDQMKNQNRWYNQMNFRNYRVSLIPTLGTVTLHL